MFQRYLVYITTNKNKTVLYIGVTSSLQRRLSQHYADATGMRRTFAGQYNCYHLIYLEGFDNINQAILREKELKKWRREKKERLIEKFNPDWEFLNNHFF